MALIAIEWSEEGIRWSRGEDASGEAASPRDLARQLPDRTVVLCRSDFYMEDDRQLAILSDSVGQQGHALAGISTWCPSGAGRRWRGHRAGRPGLSLSGASATARTRSAVPSQPASTGITCGTRSGSLTLLR